MKRVLLAGAIALALMTYAAASNWYDAGGAGTINAVLHYLNGSNVAVPASASNPFPVSAVGASGTPTQTSVSVTNASTTVLAAATATTFLKVCIASTAANGAWFRWDGATATQAAPAEYVPPGQCDSWVKSSGFLPTSTITAIASATVAVTVIYN